MLVVWLQIFIAKNSKTKSATQVFMNIHAGFCYQSKEKVLSSNTLRRMQMLTRKDKIENLIDDDLEKSSPDETDNDSNDETEFNNNESNK